MRDLIERAKAGDREAFSELARLWVDKLYAIAFLILRDPERAGDATQEALVACWRDIRGLRDPDHFDSWIRRVLVRSCYREARRARVRRRMELQVAPLDLAESPDPALALADRDQLERCFRFLDPEQRALIALHFYAGLSLQETAGALGLPVGTVKSRLHRTTQALRASLDAEARKPRLIEGRSA
jgi:RNA polymerase sigma-70 factor (ECF subfamily)